MSPDLPGLERHRLDRTAQHHDTIDGYEGYHLHHQAYACEDIDQLLI